jgi:poly-beta-1,6-N-acetyl-D-glucosamine synthase
VSAEWLLMVLVFGVNFTLWSIMGALRVIETACQRHLAGWSGHGIRRHRRSGTDHAGRGVLVESRGRKVPPGEPVTLSELAILMPAHNEEDTIESSIVSITRLVSPNDVYVVSDGSTDRTVELARRHGVQVIETPANVGKAGALQEGIRRFELVERYRAVLLLDADTQLSRNFLDAALPLFDDPDVVAVAGCAHTEWNPSGVSLLGKLLISHRARIYAITQRLIKVGQTWRRSNALYIVPGFASIYRTRVLPHIDINPPGLVIEDFNMTFEVYQKRLGRVDFTLDAWAVTQDPDRFGDYVRQTKRWALGFWQTVRRHRPQANLFTVMLALLLIEHITSSTLFVLLPVLIILGILPTLFPGVLDIPGLGEACFLIATHVDLEIALFAVLLPDLLLTVFVAVIERRPRYLLFAPAFLALRIVDSLIALYTLPRAWTERSTGRWVSPTRR